MAGLTSATLSQVDLRHGVGQLLQPAVVGEPAVPDRRVGPEHQLDARRRPARRRGPARPASAAQGHGPGREGRARDEAVVEGLPPELVEGRVLPAPSAWSSDRTRRPPGRATAAVQKSRTTSWPVRSVRALDRDEQVVGGPARRRAARSAAGRSSRCRRRRACRSRSRGSASSARASGTAGRSRPRTGSAARAARTFCIRSANFRSGGALKTGFDSPIRSSTSTLPASMSAASACRSASWSAGRGSTVGV